MVSNVLINFICSNRGNDAVIKALVEHVMYNSDDEVFNRLLEMMVMTKEQYDSKYDVKGKIDVHKIAEYIANKDAKKKEISNVVINYVDIVGGIVCASYTYRQICWYANEDCTGERTSYKNDLFVYEGLSNNLYTGSIELDYIACNLLKD